MSSVDWIVLVLTILSIVCYGIYKSRGTDNIQGYLIGSQSLPWYHVFLSVVATQASAITFLSAPGLAYSTGMSFVQFYFGLPLAMIVLCITFVPIFHSLKIYTAYEYLEQRFDLRTRALTSLLFLIQRGLSTGITIYAPSIILSTILNINTTYTTLFIGGLVIFYTVYGGSLAVSHTQLFQMSIIFAGLFIAGIIVVHMLPANIGFGKALHIAGKMGHTNAIDFKFDWNNQYNVWSGLIGGFFLQLSYFGTDQSQVGRYLTGSSVAQSRMGLLVNGLVKVPMQFLILLIGILVFTFYQYNEPPVFFNQYELNKLETSSYKPQLDQIKKQHATVFAEKNKLVDDISAALDKGEETIIEEKKRLLKASDNKLKAIKQEMTDLMLKNDPSSDINDNNYVFLSFVTKYLPQGLIGLLVAIIFLASMGSTASALNSLASTTVIDIYKRLISKGKSDAYYLRASRWITIIWGLFCIWMALYANRLGNLIEAVNILGSLFYGTILGVFIVAFYLKKIGGTATFWAAVITELIIISLWWFNVMAFLWLNVVGCLLVAVISYLIQPFTNNKPLIFDKPKLV